MSWLFGNTLSADNQDSPVGYAGEHIQRWTDPLSWVSGGRWADLTSRTIPSATNRVLEPIAKPLNRFDQTVNPLRQIPMVNNLANLGHAKPGDSIGMTIGGIFAAPALAGAAGATGGGGAVAGGAADAGAIGAADVGGAGAAAGGSGGGFFSGLSGLFGGGGSGGAGAGGLTGLFSGPAAYGDAGMTGAVSSGGSGLGGAMGGDLGGALGSSPTGLFSGLLPGGGMTVTSSGALGGGLSGEVAGASPLGGASMGGLFSGGGMNQQQMMQQAQQLMKQNDQERQQQMGGGGFGGHLAYGNPRGQTTYLGPSMPYTQFNGSSAQQSPLQTAALMQAGARPFGGFYG